MTPRVRKAVAHAIKRDEIVKAAFFGRGSTLEHLPITETSDFFNPELKDAWRYDPTLAKKLLAEAGHPNGFTCTFLSTAQYGMHKDTAEVVQQNLAADRHPGGAQPARLGDPRQLGNEGQYDRSQIGGMRRTATIRTGSPTPRRLAGAVLRAQHRRARPDEIEELLRAGRSEFDRAKRKAIYAEMEARRHRGGADRRLGLAQPGLRYAEGRERVQESPGRAIVLLGPDLRGDLGGMTGRGSPSRFTVR